MRAETVRSVPQRSEGVSVEARSIIDSLPLDGLVQPELIR
jgi:hypothetical protein